ncbi:hypothetical protein PanWU01x14_152590 [Parasponia andersonii]|uniref:Uncharacterized protein n=1 Tax=Parasponia andersonii TaxID=3476 RepID=A0A2P5CHD2_PARAD|nr:hypothetical protein PanWU01x14_152590 [Parasponia andersonii]
MDHNDTKCDVLTSCLTFSLGRIRVFIDRTFHNREEAVGVMANGEDNCILLLATFLFEASSSQEVKLQALQLGSSHYFDRNGRSADFFSDSKEQVSALQVHRSPS